MHTIDLVKQFHESFGHPVNKSPTASTKERRELRMRMLLEEVGELAQALGVSVRMSFLVGDDEKPNVYAKAVLESDQIDLNEVALELADVTYVNDGNFLEFGIPQYPVVAEKHRSNMSKLGDDGKPIYREDGKVIKGPNYTPANVTQILNVERGRL